MKLKPSLDVDVDYPELHEDRTEANFFRHLQKLMKTCGYNDFSWRDLYHPSPKRLRFQLSAIINLAKFREEQLRVYAELNEPRDEYVAKLNELNEENLELNEQLRVVEQASTSKNHEIDDLVAECQELEVEIAKHNKMQSTTREEAEALKKEANNLKDELATAEWTLQEMEAEEEKLRFQVVTSPHRRKVELSHRSERLQKEKDSCAKLEQEILDTKKKIENAHRSVSDLKAARSAIAELQKQVEIFQESENKVKETLQTIDETEEKTSITSKDAEEAERYLHRSEEKINHQRKQHKLELQAVQESLDAAKTNLLLVEKDRRDAMSRVEAGEQEVREMEAAIEEERIKTNKEIEDMISEFQEKATEFRSRFDRQLKAIGVI